MDNRLQYLAKLVMLLSVLGAAIFPACSFDKQRELRAKEAALRRDLYEMRTAIDKYTLDKDRAPQLLQDLVTAGYLKKIPEDPMTKSATTWQVEMETELQIASTTRGIANVRSGAKETGTGGIPYDQY